MEELGVPTAALCTDAFDGAAAEQARVLGMPGFRPVMVPHPIASLTPDAIRAKADGVVEQVIRRLTTFEG